MTTLTVEVKFDGSNWTDITSYVMQVRTRRGRNNDLDVVDPGEVTVVLNNQDGRFTPENSQGSYYPNVKPTVQVRVSVSAGAGPTSYRVFTGKAQRWEPVWEAPGHPGIVRLEAVDGFEELRNFEIDYAYRQAALVESPDGYWPLGETSAPFADRSGNGRDLRLGTADYEAGVDAQVSGGPGAFRSTSGSDPRDDALILLSPPAAWQGVSNDVTFAAMVRITSQSAPVIFEIASMRSDDPNDGFWQFGYSGGGLRLFTGDGAGGETLQSDAVTLTDDVDYHFAFHWDQSTRTVTFYRNGVEVGSDTATNPIAAFTSPTQFAAAVADGQNITMSEMVIWGSDKSSYIDDLADAVDAYASDTPGARIGRVLDWAGWDASARDIDTGTTPLAAVTSGTALAACQDAAAADGGVFFMSADGDATFQGRRERWEDPAALDYSEYYTDTYGGTVVDFDDDGTDTGYQTIGWRYDTTLLHTRVVVNSNTQGTSDGVAEDATAQSTFGTRSLSISTVSNNSADNQQRAEWELSRRKDPHLRLEEIAFLVGDTVQEDAAGVLELQSLVQVSRRPGDGQDDLVVDMRVASIEHEFADGGTAWRARFGLLDAETDQPGVYGTAVYDTDYFGY